MTTAISSWSVVTWTDASFLWSLFLGDKSTLLLVIQYLCDHSFQLQVARRLCGEPDRSDLAPRHSAWKSTSPTCGWYRPSRRSRSGSFSSASDMVPSLLEPFETVAVQLNVEQVVHAHDSTLDVFAYILKTICLIRRFHTELVVLNSEFMIFAAPFTSGDPRVQNSSGSRKIQLRQFSN